ncbi:MAG: hypothetical protein KDA67_11320 [Rhodobacteraceae bacterium]|nr:hypothetical protein [Paracoccaceae bacterium]
MVPFFFNRRDLRLTIRCADPDLLTGPDINGDAQFKPEGITPAGDGFVQFAHTDRTL